MKTRMVCIGVCVVCILFTCTHATSPIVWNTGRHEVFPPTRVAAGVAVVKQVPALKSVVSTLVRWLSIERLCVRKFLRYPLERGFV